MHHIANDCDQCTLSHATKTHTEQAINWRIQMHANARIRFINCVFALLRAKREEKRRNINTDNKLIWKCFAVIRSFTLNRNDYNFRWRCFFSQHRWISDDKPEFNVITNTLAHIQIMRMILKLPAIIRSGYWTRRQIVF